ncbi:MAG TPA: helix-turn-helix transcriptional regulator [Tepidisphaeraceae bacterium]|nr:helix-turn-helix transcriptional regulator [Tepidisphaeraceae bacterium]
MARQPNPAKDISALTALPVFSPREWATVAAALQLSPQQTRIVGLILEGKRDKQIAVALGMSISTVRTHLGRIFARLDVADRVELVLHVFARFRSGDDNSRHRQNQRQRK